LSKQTISHVRKHGITYLLTILPAATVLGLYTFIGTFNRLLGDSMCSFYFAERLGLLRSIWYWRLIWSGRYSAYAFDWLMMNLFKNVDIHLFIPLVLIVWVLVNIASIHLLLRISFHESQNIYLPAILGPLSVFFVLITMPSIEQSFLWMDGFRAYTLPIIILSIYVTIYFIAMERIKSKPSLWFAAPLTFILFFASGGLSETFAVFQFALLLFWILYYWLTERPHKIDSNFLLLLCSLCGALVSILVVASAPGNTVRQNLLPPHLGFFPLMEISLASYGKFLLDILMTPGKFTAVIGMVAISLWAGFYHQGQLKAHALKIILLILGAVCLSFSCFPPSVYAYSEAPPARVMSISIFILVTFSMAAGFLTGNLLQQKKLPAWITARSFLAIAIPFLFISSWINARILYENKAIYIEYATKWDKTDALIKQAKNEGLQIVEIPEMSNWALLDRPNQNPNHWANECYSSFYGIKVFGPP
jgi:hypothetical protein